MANAAVLCGILIAVSVMLLFVATLTTVSPRDPVEARMDQFGVSSELPAPATSSGRRRWPLISRLLQGFGMGSRLARALTRADVAMTAAEFALIMLGAASIGLAVGLLRGSTVVSLALSPVLGALPFLYLKQRGSRRQQAFMQQLPDMLTLLVGALRAGHGLAQAIGMIAAQMPEPTSTELKRVQRGVGLGLSTARALEHMAERLNSDDLDLVVTAMEVQLESGGDLAMTLDTIAETVRDRIRMKREIRSLTAQQRFTGYVLALLPVGLGVALYMVSPANMSKLFQPDRIMVPAGMACLEVMGYLWISRIVAIEV
jgi:tight adherence protein B